MSAAPRMRKVDTGALLLEPLRAEHAEAMFEVLSDPAIYEYENAPPESLEWLRNRYVRLESRRSGDGRELWLNWVIRLPTNELIGYVQASVGEGRAAIAYELASRYWNRGLGSSAVAAMVDELVDRYGVTQLTAVAKQNNQRSQRLLQRLGFEYADPATCEAANLEDDEVMMTRKAQASGLRR